MIQPPIRPSRPGRGGSGCGRAGGTAGPARTPTRPRRCGSRPSSAGRGHVDAVEAGLDLGHPGLELGPIGQHRALGRGPRPDLAAAGPGGEVVVGHLGRRALGPTGHPHLATQDVPGEADRDRRVLVDLAALLAVVVREERRAPRRTSPAPARGATTARPSAVAVESDHGLGLVHAGVADLGEPAAELHARDRRRPRARPGRGPGAGPGARRDPWPESTARRHAMSNEKIVADTSTASTVSTTAITTAITVRTVSLRVSERQHAGAARCRRGPGPARGRPSRTRRHPVECHRSTNVATPKSAGVVGQPDRAEVDRQGDHAAATR